MNVILQTNLKYVYEDFFFEKDFVPITSNFNFALKNARN